MGTSTGPSKDTQGLPLLFTTDDSRGQIFLSSSFLPHQPLFFLEGEGSGTGQILEGHIGEYPEGKN